VIDHSGERLRYRETIGSAKTKPSGPVTFVNEPGYPLRLQMDQNAKNAFGSVTVDGRAVSEKIDEYLRLVVKERCEELHALDKIPAVLDRRIDVAVNAAVDGLRVEMVAAARARLLSRLNAAVDAVPLSVAVTAGEEAKP